MSYNRSGVLAGQSIELRIILTDDTGTLVDTDALPDVYIYDESVTTTTIGEEITAGVFTSALAGPLVPSRLGLGYYSYTYSVPGAGDEGDWHDVWVGQVGGIDIGNFQTFTVVSGATVSIQQLAVNQMVVIELDSTIADTSSTPLTLGVDTQLSFLTILDPLFASPDLLRMEMGPILGSIPDDTLALAIHWASKYAEFISPPSKCTMNDRWQFARTMFVLYDAMYKLMMLPGLANSSLGGAGKKALGDLYIDNSASRASGDTMSSGVDTKTFSEIEQERKSWFKVVNSGACLNPGQSVSPTFAIKGRFDPDRRIVGRQWAHPSSTRYAYPGSNTRRVPEGYRRARHVFETNRGR